MLISSPLARLQQAPRMTRTQRSRRNPSARPRRNQNTMRHTSSSSSIGPISSLLFVGLLVTIISLLYLVQITKTSVYGYEVGELKSQQEQLLEENESLRVEAARLQSLERVESSELASEFVPVNDVTFLDN